MLISKSIQDLFRETAEWFSRYSVGCYYHILNKGFPTTSDLDVVALQFHASHFITAYKGTDRHRIGYIWNNNFVKVAACP